MALSEIDKIRKSRRGVEAYTERDYNALLSILKYRCLSMQQIFDLNYSTNIVTGEATNISYAKKKMCCFRHDCLIEKVYNRDKDIPNLYALTGFGLRFLKKCMPHIFSPENNQDKIFSADISFRQLQLSPSLIPHQYHLNCFAIAFLQLFEQVTDKKYTDERHMQLSDVIRPDGLCIIPQKTVHVNGVEKTIPETHFFFECDMGTETPNFIKKKFTSYRAHLISSKHNPNIRSVVLFICKDPEISFVGGSNTKPSAESRLAINRINRLKASISEAVLDLIGERFEVLVATHFKLLTILKLLYLPEYLGVDAKTLLPSTENIIRSNHPDLEVKDVVRLSKYTNGVEYSCYAKSQMSQKLFVFLECFGDPMSIIKKVEWHKKNTGEFTRATGKQLNLVIVGNKEQSIDSLNEICVLSNPKFDNVYCTTVNRLSSLPFHKAIYKITTYGTATFDETLNTLIPETYVRNAKQT